MASAGFRLGCQTAATATREEGEPFGWLQDLRAFVDSYVVIFVAEKKVHC